jgi:ribose 5-phosphate isomerase A
MSADAQKRLVGEAAAGLVERGMTVGLGTGSTAAFFITSLGKRNANTSLHLRCVPTSIASADLATKLGLKVIDLDAAGRIDLTVDGADEMNPDLVLIKGAGGALLREKLVWEASERCVVIADAAKQVQVLGAFPLSVEVIAFGCETTARRIRSVLEREHLEVTPRLRIRDGTPVRTDGGNVIYDLPLGAIPAPDRLGPALKAITGVVEHGLFIGLAGEALVGTDNGVVSLRPGVSAPQMLGQPSVSP